MSRRVWLSVVACIMALCLGVFMGWKLGRAAAGLPGQLLQVGRVPSYKPVEVVPDSVNWPAGEPVTVATVAPPTIREFRRVEKDFGLDLDEAAILGKFRLPDLPDGGRAVVSVPVSDSPEPVSLIVKANPPPLVRVRWEPRIEGWFGYGAESGRTFETSWSGYLQLDRLICLRGRVCLNARSGYERRPWGDGVVAEAGVSIRF